MSGGVWGKRLKDDGSTSASGGSTAYTNIIYFHALPYVLMRIADPKDKQD